MNIDQDIYKRLAARDESGLSMLYDHYVEALYGMAFRVLQNEAYAEDAIQKSFLKIWENIHQYDEAKSTLFTWMARIVKNTAIDISRLVSFQKEQKSETFDTTVHKVSSTETNTDAIDTASMVQSLDPKYSDVIKYIYLHGYSQKEVSEKLGIPIGTVKTRVKKAIDILRGKYKNDQTLISWIIVIILLLI